MVKAGVLILCLRDSEVSSSLNGLGSSGVYQMAMVTT
jgi:hypothetical protein